MTKPDKQRLAEMQAKRRQTNIAKYGSEEAYREEMKRRASLSSRNARGTGGFAHLKRTDPDKLKETSRLALEKRWGKHGLPEEKAH
jgi:hypothetical protein